MPRPAEWFVRALVVLDPLLSVRWGDVIGQYVIERKAVVPVEEIAFLRRHVARLRYRMEHEREEIPKRLRDEHVAAWKGTSEELVSAERGKRVIIITSVLSDKIFNYLCQSDIKRYGGYARFADYLETEEERAESEKLRIETNKAEALDKEVHGIISFLQRRKGTYLDRNCTDLRLMLHGEHTTPDSEPLIDTSRI